MNSIIITTIVSTIVMSIYYFTTFKEETKNETYPKFLISILFFLLLYVAIFVLIFNIIEIYKSYVYYSKIVPNSVATRRAREDNFARLLARRAPDPDNVINPLFDRSPQFLSGPFGQMNPRANQIAYTFYNN